MRRNDNFPVRREPDWDLAPWTETSGFFPSSFFGGSPWQMLRRMQEDMDRAFSQVLSGQFGEGRGAGPSQPQWSPSIDVSETPTEWCIEADLPGARKDDIHVHVHNHQLHLRAEMRQGQETPPGGQQGGSEQQRQYYRRERRYGFIERVMPLPRNVDEENVRCELRDGVLRIHLPKAQQATPQGRRIPIGEGETTQSSRLGTGGTPAGTARQTARPTASGETTGQGTDEQHPGAETIARGSNGRKATVAGAKGGQAATPRKPRGRKGEGAGGTE